MDCSMAGHSYRDRLDTVGLTPRTGGGTIGTISDRNEARHQPENPPMTRRPLLIPMMALALSLGSTGLADDRDWTSLFDGKSLDGWKVNGGSASYKVEGGAIVGTTVEGSPNTFLCKGDFKDFVLELEVKCDPALNSGVQVRSHVYGKDDPDPKNSRRAGVVYGPQCEVARKETGTAGRFYDEGRRGKWLDEIKPEAKDAFKDDGWNRYKIVVQGNRYRSWINGVAASDFTDDVDKSGFIGLQVHGIAKGQGPYQVRWRDILIKELNPGEEVSSAEPPDGFKAVFNLEQTINPPNARKVTPQGQDKPRKPDAE
jgi:hypothetical protein